MIDQIRPVVLLGNLAFQQTITVPAWSSNGQMWSLAYEFWFYGWFAALSLLLSRRRFLLALLGLAVAWIYPT